jgi:hypothetical protein
LPEAGSDTWSIKAIIVVAAIMMDIAADPTTEDILDATTDMVAATTGMVAVTTDMVAVTTVMVATIMTMVSVSLSVSWEDFFSAPH